MTESLGIHGQPEYVATACVASLRRMAVDHNDIHYQHRVDSQVPIEGTVGAMHPSSAQRNRAVTAHNVVGTGYAAQAMTPLNR